ncbi:hypothetical protein BKA70DRAFT_1408411 [Coprinopsis sp. MPI-PUGE-AT-0042]|nr:hypothetical protein BKA70DRAFT_1408411 [Coprinopsis sp. MPI-PUGE-AT-0042]
MEIPRNLQSTKQENQGGVKDRTEGVDWQEQGHDPTTNASHGVTRASDGEQGGEESDFEIVGDDDDE